MKKRGNRDQMVIATKFTTCYRAGYGDKEIIINTAGNGTKSLHLSLEASLRKLQTSYVDLVCYSNRWVEDSRILTYFLALRSLVGFHMLYS
jgi:aryl-alcohol dehydrogenase-like predicted oxidoreductase